jgi:hypothetical protein
MEVEEMVEEETVVAMVVEADLVVAVVVEDLEEGNLGVEADLVVVEDLEVGMVGSSPPFPPPPMVAVDLIREYEHTETLFGRGCFLHL